MVRIQVVLYRPEQVVKLLKSPLTQNVSNTMSKRCSRCETVKLHSHYNKNKAKIDGLQTTCRECSNVASKAYYKKNRTRHCNYVAERRESYRQDLRDLMWDFYSNNPCVDCGEADPIVLEHDHLGDKTMGVSVMVSRLFSWKRIREEIDKCVVRCANCHRRKTAREGGWYATKVW